MDLEDLHRVVVQGFASLNDKIDSVNASLSGRIDSLSDRIDSVNTSLGGRIDALSGRIDGVDRRIDSLEAHMDIEFGRVKEVLMDHGRQLKDIRVALDRKVDRDELQARS